MAAIALDGSTVQNNNGVGATTVALANCAWTNGDKVFVAIAVVSGTTVSSISGGGLTWSKVTDGTHPAQGSTGIDTELWEATAASTQSGITVTVTLSASAVAEATFFALTNCGATNAVATSNWSGSSAALNAPSVTDTTSPTQVVVICSETVGGHTFAAPSGYTILGTAQIDSGGQIVAMLQTATNNSTGTVSPGQIAPATGGPTGSGNSFSIAFVNSSLPAAPSVPTIASETATDMQINPGALSTGATSLNIQVTLATDGGFASPVATVTGATPSANNAVTGLTANTAYIARVQAVNANGTTNGTATVSTPTLPAAPTGLAVSAVALTTQLSLSWSAPAGGAVVLTYNVLRSTINGSGYTQVATGISSTTWTDNTGLAGSTNYYYVVQAVNVSGAGVNSAQGTGILLTCPAAPTGLSLTPGNNQITVNWVDAAGAVSTNVKRSNTSGGTYTNVAGGGAVPGSSFIDTTASNGSSYYYEVSNNNTSGEGPATAFVGPEFIGTPVPTSVTATYEAGVGILVSWTAPAGFTGTGYNIYRLKTGSYNGVAMRQDIQPLTNPIPWGTTSFLDEKMGLGEQYTYYVSTLNAIAGQYGFQGNTTVESALSAASSAVTFSG